MMSDHGCVVSMLLFVRDRPTNHFLCDYRFIAQVDSIHLGVSILVHTNHEVTNGRSRVYQACAQGSVGQRSRAHAISCEELDARGFEDIRKSFSGIPRRKGEQSLSSAVAALGAGNYVVITELSG
jgi:hypothetical protein